jgi:hypothetical protein
MKGLIITEEEKKRIRNLYSTNNQRSLIAEEEKPTISDANEIWQFQSWVWNKVEGKGDPDKSDPKVLYSSTLCNTSDGKCYVYGVRKRVPGTSYDAWYPPAAIDGMWGPKLLELWNKYWKRYTKENPNWRIKKPEINAKLLGQEIPTTLLQAKNFQQWYLEEIEKSQPNKYGLYTTKLCSSPCTLNKAVSGEFNSQTQDLWLKYRSSYMGANKLWMVEKPWTASEQKVIDAANSISDEDIAMLNLPNFYEDPSGWDGVSAMPSLRTDLWGDWNGELWVQDGNAQSWGGNKTGWDKDNTIFPYPRKYTKEEIDMFLESSFVKRGSASEYYYSLNPENPKESQATVSDALRVDNSVAKQKISSVPNMSKDIENWDKKLREAEYASKNKIGQQMKKWNQDFDRQITEIPKYCKYIGLTIGSVRKYINPELLCSGRGGLWVYDVEGSKQRSCGCRAGTPNIDVMNESNGKSFYINPSKLMKNTEQRKEFQYDDVTDWADVVNDIIPVISIPLAIFGSAVAAPLTIGRIVLALDMVDAAAYAVKGDAYGFGLALTFGIIGGAEVLKEIPAVKQVWNGSENTLKSVMKEGQELFEKIKFGRLDNAGRKALARWSKALKEIAEKIKSGWLTNKIYTVTKITGEALQKVTVTAAKISFNLFKISGKVLYDVIMFLIKSDNLPISFIRNFGINVAGGFLTWDAIAYFTGICNTMPMTKSMDELLKEIESLKKKSVFAMDEEEREILDGEPWAATVTFVKTLGSFQQLSTPCSKLNVFNEMKKNKKLQEDILKYQTEKFTESNKAIYKKEIEKIGINGYTDIIDAFDPTIYAIQCVLKHWSDKKSLGKEIDNWGIYDQSTKDLIKEFKKYAGITYYKDKTEEEKNKTISNTKINKKGLSNIDIDDNDVIEDAGIEKTESIDSQLATNLIKFIDQVPEDMKNYNNVDFSAKGIKDLEKMMIDLIEGSKDKGPSAEEIEPIKRAIDDLDGVSEDQKRGNINGLEKIMTKEVIMDAINEVGPKPDKQ